MFSDPSPINPETELTKINKAETVAVCFTLPQPNINMIGLRIIPPPMPIIPENKPSTPPVINPGKRFNSLSGVSEYLLNIPEMRSAAIIRNNPSILLYQTGSSVIPAPMNAIGTDAIAKG